MEASSQSTLNHELQAIAAALSYCIEDIEGLSPSELKTTLEQIQERIISLQKKLTEK